MNDIGLPHRFLGIEIYQEDNAIFIICQKKYAEKILKKFRMSGCKLTDIKPITTEQEY
jgi:hypothetical protein